MRYSLTMATSPASSCHQQSLRKSSPGAETKVTCARPWTQHFGKYPSAASRVVVAGDDQHRSLGPIFEKDAQGLRLVKGRRRRGRKDRDFVGRDAAFDQHLAGDLVGRRQRQLGFLRRDGDLRHEHTAGKPCVDQDAGHQRPRLLVTVEHHHVLGRPRTPPTSSHLAIARSRCGCVAHNSVKMIASALRR